MQLNYQQGEYPFPNEFVPPKKKAKDDYGLQAAKAMFYSRNRQGYSIFTQQNQNVQALIELAQGRQSTDNIRKMFGFFTDGKSNSDDGNLAYIDIQVINLATKYVNRAVAKLQKYKYKIGLSAVDPISVDEAKEYDAKIRCYYALKDYYKAMGQQAQQFYEDVQVDILPEYPEEIMFQLSANQKIRKIIDGEKTLQLVNGTINDTSQIMREFDWDLVVQGHGHIHCYHDENKMPKAERIEPEYWLGSYVENEDHKKQEYAAFVDFITVNQFRREAEDKLSQEDIEKVLKSHSWPNTATSWNTLPDQMVNYDGLQYIPVMRFYFLSNDHTATAFWKNEEGAYMRAERAYDYKPGPDKKRKEDIIKQVYTTVYGGSWVVDSDIVYNYGPKDIPRSNLVDARLPIITFAPNMKKGRYVSLLSQMIEPLTMFNVAWNKVKGILAKERLGILNINFSAFENLSIGKGGNNWTPRQAIEFLFQTNTAVSRTQMNPYGGSVGKNVEFTATGVTLADYFTTMSTCIRILDDLSGSTLAETNELPDRLTSKTMMANVAAGSDAIEYLVNAHTQGYYQMSHMLLLLTQASKRDKVAIKGMIPALGKYTTEWFEIPDDLPYCDYGLSMEREATPEEWAEFYAQLADGVAKGMLNGSDSAFLREITDMTMARFALATREKINEKKAAQMRQQEQQFQMQTAEQAAKAKLEMEMALQADKAEKDKELAILNGKIQERLIEKEKELEAEIAGVTAMVQKKIHEQAGIDSVIKEAMRSQAERYKSDNKREETMVKTSADERKALLDAQVKIKTAKKKESGKK